MKRKLLSVLLCICALFSLTEAALATQETRNIEITYRAIAVTLDGEPLIPVDAQGVPVEPFISGGTTYLPVRGIANALDLTVAWDNQTNTVLLSSGGTPTAPVAPATFSQKTENKNAVFRDIAIVLDGQPITPKDASGANIEPFILDGTTYLPVRAVATALNLSVSWDDQTSTVQLAHQYRVTRVVDGDTIVVDFNGTEEKIRLIGVDTPESVHPDSSKNSEAGLEASEYTRSMLEGKYVTLEFDVQQRDMYGRLLAYVYLDGVMFNKTLLENGYATISTFPPNVRYVDEFAAIVSALHPQDTDEADSSMVVYVTKTGSRYHLDPHCNGGTYYESTLGEALARGLTPCQKCAQS